MRRARTCYNHLAGALAVTIADRMVECGQLDFTEDGAALTAAGVAFFGSLGVELGSSGRRGGRVFCRPCLDWSERRPHIAGAVGTALCARCFDAGWIRRIPGTRAVSMTRAGQAAFSSAFGL